MGLLFEIINSKILSVLILKVLGAKYIKNYDLIYPTNL